MEEKRYCECGCKQEVNYSKQYKRWSRFVVGHNTRTWTKEIRTKQSKSMIKTKRSVEGRKRQSEAIKKMYKDNPEYKLNLSEKVAELWKNSDYRSAMVDSHNEYWSNPKNRKRLSDDAVERYKDNTVKDKISETLKQYCKENPGLLRGKNNGMFGRKYVCSDEKREAHRLATIKRFIDIRERIKISCASQNIPIENWTGFTAQEPYCQIWTEEYKDFIRERDYYRCQNPDCLGISDTLCVHHIDYVKKNCEPSNLITLCTSCNSIANYNREYWENRYKKLMKSGG